MQVCYFLYEVKVLEHFVVFVIVFQRVGPTSDEQHGFAADGREALE